jgi:8-oxo-dGTP pyrophosphatase MutT (NUDIX family)
VKLILEQVKDMTDIYKGNIPWIHSLPNGLTPEKFEIAARALIVFENRVLLVYEEATKTWYTPGGRLTPDEDMRAACLREIREETGLEATLDDLLTVWDTVIPRDGYLAKKFEFVFKATLTTPPDFIEREHEDADQSEAPVSKIRWFTAQETATLPNVFPTFIRQWSEWRLQ